MSVELGISLLVWLQLGVDVHFGHCLSGGFAVNDRIQKLFDLARSLQDPTNRGRVGHDLIQ